MNCQQCREELAAYLEGLLNEPVRVQIEAHLAECSTCPVELKEVQELVAHLTRDGLDAPQVSLETPVMDRILRQQALELRRLTMRKRLRVWGISGAAAAAIALFIFSGFWLAEPAAAQKAAAQALAQGAEAAANPTTIHIVAKMRTSPHDNFSHLDPELEPVRLEIWKQFGNQPKWRVEKPGRVAVMDGASTAMLIRPDYYIQFPHPSSDAFDNYWLLALASVQDMISRELCAAQAKGWDLQLTHENTASGRKLIVTVEAKSGLPAGDYLQNKFFEDSDTRRVYRFDAQTKRLEGFDAYLHQPGGDVLILSVERIEYGQPIDAAVFTLKLPAKVSVYQEPQRLPDNEKYEKMTPEQAARAFFEACAKKDWDEVQKFNMPCDERLQQYLGGLQLVHLGTPFQSKNYPGWFVPYEIKLAMPARFQVRVRNDNPAKRYVVFSPGDKYDAKRLAKLKPLPDQKKYEKMTPAEAVAALFQAYAKKDAAEAYKFVEGVESLEDVKKEMGYLRIADYRVGKPTATKEPGCWAIPVEYHIIKTHNLAVRSDNPAKRFIVDGGI